MDLPITVSKNLDIPLFLQLKYQLSYLIASNRLREGSRMPSVREMASVLGISPVTVQQAYKALNAEGLVVTYDGKGTFVAERPVPTDGERRRQERLDAVLHAALTSAAALGFNQNELHQRFLMALGNADLRTRVLFVGPSRLTAAKYARLLETHFPGNVRGSSIAVDDLSQPREETVEQVRSHYYFVSPARLERQVGARLDAIVDDYMFIGITVSVTQETIDRLARLDPDETMCLITERQYVNSSLSIISTHSSVPLDEIGVAYDSEMDKAKRLTASSSVVFHTYGVRQLLEDLGVPKEKWFELGLDFSPESLFRIRESLKL